MKTTLLKMGLAMMVAFTLSACSSDDDSPIEQPQPDNEQTEPEEEQPGTELTKSAYEIAKIAQSKFAFELFSTMAKDEEPNTLIAPYSVSTLVSILANGADPVNLRDILKKFEVKTLDELNQINQRVVAELSESDPLVTCTSSNSIWVGGNYLNPDFANTVKAFYDAECYELGASLATQEGVNRINGWISEKSHGLLTGGYSPIAEDVTVIANVNYLKAPWTDKFPLVAEGNFQTPDKNYITIEYLIRADGFKYAYLESPMAAVAASIPYGNGNYRLNLIMPKDDDADINEFANAFDYSCWEVYTAAIDKQEAQEGLLSVPKVKVMSQPDINTGLNTVLPRLVGSMYVNMCKPANWLFPLQHGVALEINEEGAEAAGGSIGAIPVGDDFLQIAFWKPYMIVIDETTTGTILFMGTITNPKL